MYLETVVAHFGNKLRVAEALGITSGAVSQWGEKIPQTQALLLEKITSGELIYDPSLYAKKTASVG